ncbi:MAG TPA: glycosyltransferase family 2 protein [Prolixibacteraceae bacterium]|nr:glycosyltransferase family 2 protein [Prolixibacteraceae bacterium]
MNTIAVVILNWNGLADTIECVESVLKQSFTNYKIFLVDNASSSYEFDALSQRFGQYSNFEMMRNSTNIGFGIAHNLVFEKLITHGYKTVALINNDAVAQNDWLEKSLQVLEAENADIVACKMVQYYRRDLLDSAGLKMLNTGEILPRGHGYSAERFRRVDHVVSFCAGACLMQLSVIEKIGGFDPFFDTGYEDAELGLRATVSGHKIVYAPEAVVYHKMGQSLVKIKSHKRTLKIMRDVNYSALKNLPLANLVFNFPFYFVRNLFVVVLFGLSCRWRYISYFFNALFCTLQVDFKIILKNRELVNKKIGFFAMLNKQEFFVRHDFARFINFIVKRKPHKFEQ